MVTVKAYRGANSLDTDSTNCNGLRPGEGNTVEILLDQRVNQLTQLLRQTLAFRIPTPPQSDENEVDNGGRTDYRFEELRLQSYQNWPSPYVQPSDLAAAGFYYTGKNDSVRCFECHIEFSRWEEGEDPMTLHQRWNGRCYFIRKIPCGNVPIGVDSNSIPVPRPRSRDTYDPYVLQYRMNAEADNDGAKEFGEERPKFPKYATYDARLQSFDDWPISMSQTKEQLAEAGLYYVGRGDMTACYQCGVALKSWEPQDDPWVQHAKWRPTCSLVATKGQEFIDNAVGKDAIPPLEAALENVALVNNVETLEPSVLQIRESVEESNGQTMVGQDVVGISNIPPVPTPRANIAAKTENSLRTTSTNGDRKSEEPEEKLLDDATICKICYDDVLGVVFVPCGHIVSCLKCAPSLTTCAVCRKKIEYYARVYLS
ncbi:baculoviral IAP repeat-containing protein 2-like [Phymastichus coffea]|uniref:baculoviral IAP repeat-containing protein 2-like n=1 Tax=Phymastichus coffea TaxID=108790 RepID=UPI00273BDD80|nr:baculoviral IAP repeat-containing protein 2-like [Phymastichus coffea]